MMGHLASFAASIVSSLAAPAVESLPASVAESVADSAGAWFTIGTYEVRNDDLWIVGTAILCCVSCGVLGCFLVLRRMSLLGDAISHAILPGIAAAFLISGSREPLAMLGGALVVGVITAFLSSALHRWGRVQEDAAMGVVFTTLFAIGVVLISWAARDVDLDPGCVLYGLIEFTPFDTVRIGGMEIPRSFAWLLAIFVVDSLIVWVFFKELKIVAFDPGLATTMGISATLVHYGVMTLVASTAVASFEAVGSILVVAMLVAPGATAHLLTDRLSRMLWIAAGLAAVAAIAGYALAVWVDTSVAGMIATVSLGLFVTAVLGAPRHGVIGREWRRLSLAVRIAMEDALSLLYRRHERGLSDGAASAPGSPAIDSPAPISEKELIRATRAGLIGRVALHRLRRGGLIEISTAGAVTPTRRGLDAAAPLIRGHRLWESFLARDLNLPLDHVHAGAHRAEHFLTDEIREQLHAETPDGPDPHGRPIPPGR